MTRAVKTTSEFSERSCNPLSARMSKITNDGLTPVWHKMLHSCTHMATVGVKGLKH